MNSPTLRFRYARLATFALFALLCAVAAQAQTSLTVYVDGLVNGFQDWSWVPVAQRNFNNTSPVHTGSRSISATAAYWEGISFHHSEFDSSPYSEFTFWAHGGSTGGQRFQVYAEYGSSSAPAYTLPGSLPANAWQQFKIPLGSLGVANRPNVHRITIQLRNDGTSGTFYLDDIEFTAKPVPTLVNVSLNATQSVRIADARHFGVNLAIWDGTYEPNNYATTAALLNEMGCTTVRMPGGSLSDEYHWSSNTTLSNAWQWQTSFAEFMRVATNVNAQAFVTVNYGSGSPQEAAAWVAYANGDAALYGTPGDITIGVDPGGRDWRTAGYWARLRSLTAASNPDNQFDFLAMGRSAPLGIRNWEIGNECYGTWERDTNALPNHAYTYAIRATNYIALMKAIDPTIKVGVVGVPGESAYANGYTDHPARNPRTGQTNYGWTPVLLTTLKNVGVTPDFLVHHHYPQWTDPNNVVASPDNDVTLLQSTGNWASDAANLRQQISDYFGSAGTNIELVVTENNSDAGQQGRQSTSLVNGLYYADSLSQLLKTEFKGFVWWDLRNGTDTAGFFGSNIYGWRTYGDLGMINGLNTRHPTFYAAKLMQWFARPGDKILNPTTDYNFLSAYAARRANGSITLLVLNKSLVTNLNAQITLNGYIPGAPATIRSFGIPNDEAARTNGPAAAQDVTTSSITNAGTSFMYSFPKLSMTLFTLMPTAPRLAVLPQTAPEELVVQLQGQADVPYVIQGSSNLVTWFATATNTPTSNTLNVTNPISPDSSMKFFRAVWQP
jgi:hypothetical protein